MTSNGRTQSSRGLLGGLTYFEYQKLVSSRVVIPWLAKRLRLNGRVIGDVGAHHGGMLEALRETGVVRGAVGLELRQDVVTSSPFITDDRFTLENRDLLSVAAGEYVFDLVLLHDVLEHVPDHGAFLQAVRRSLSPCGHVFVSFPPYFSAFGGHQQLARGWARVVPFIHILPSKLFFRLAHPGANEYMSARDSLDDMIAVRRTRLTLRRAERAFAAAGFEVIDRELYLVRPEYTIRYGLPHRGPGVLGRLPAVQELAVNGAFYLLRSRGTCDQVRSG